MKRATQITAILILSFWGITQMSAQAVDTPVVSVVSPQITDAETSSQKDEDLFAPIDLDLTDYTNMNKKNKKFELSAEKEGKPAYVQNTGQIWDEDMLFRRTYYSDETNLRVLPSYGSLNSYVTRPLDENTTVMIGQDGISEINGDTVNFANEH